MASFVIHHIVGERLLSLLEEYGVKLKERQKIHFLLGNLIPDTSKLKFECTEGENIEKIKKQFRSKVQDEKKITHFREVHDRELCIKVPDMDRFISKYERILEIDLAVMGYLLHLYTDKVFFSELFPITFDNLDENLNFTIYEEDAIKIRSKKNGKVYNRKDFWSGNGSGSIYGDYTIMNKILLDYYNICFDKNRFLCNLDQFINPGIEEVDFNNIVSIINSTSAFIDESNQIENGSLIFFREEDVKDFIERVANNFVQDYFEYLKVFSNGNVLQRRLILIKET